MYTRLNGKPHTRGYENPTNKLKLILSNAVNKQRIHWKTKMYGLIVDQRICLWIFSHFFISGIDGSRMESHSIIKFMTREC